MTNPHVFDFQFRVRYANGGWGPWMSRETAHQRDYDARLWLQKPFTTGRVVAVEARDLLVVNVAQVTDQLDLFPGMVAHG